MPDTRNQDIVAEVLTALGTPEGQADPYPHYARLRALGPVAIGPDGTAVISGYRLCSSVLRDHRLQKNPERMLAGAGHPNWRDRPGLRLLYTSFLVLSPPEHTRLRRLVSGVFTARRVAELRPAIEAIADDLCARIDGDTDFVDAFAFPLPVAVIGELLGIPPSDRPMFQGLVRDWTMVLDVFTPEVVDRADAAAITIRDYLADLADHRRARPADDVISALAAARDGTDALTEEELITTAALLLAAGFETTTGLLGNGLLALINHPDQADLFRAKPELAPVAIDELLRYDSSVQLVSTRSAPTDLTVDDQLDLHEGQRTLGLLGAANRDPEVFADPDRLILDRAAEPPLSFGGGIHYCLGAPLARLEAQIAFPALLSHFRDIALAGPPVHRQGLALHSHVSLPVTMR
jgi:cytochrome P450